VPEGDLLILLADLSVALAGFSGVVVALQRRIEEFDQLAFLRLWRLIETSLASALFSVLPLLLSHLGIAASDLWRVSSGVFGTYMLTVTSYFIWRIWPLLSANRVLWRFNGPLILINAAAVVALLANAGEVGLHGSSGPYLTGIVIYLLLAGLVFRRLVLARRGSFTT
jgi:hypothetical protein